MLRTRRSVTVPKRLSRRINFGHALETKGAKTGTAMWAGGIGLLGQQMLSEKMNGALPAIGLGGVLIGVPLMKYSTNTGINVTNKNLLNLVGKKRVALATAKRVTNLRVRAVLLLIASAKSEEERNAIRTMINDGISQECGNVLTHTARRALSLEDSAATRQLHKLVRGFRGMEERKLVPAAIKIEKELRERRIRDGYTYNLTMAEYATPIAISHAMDYYRITNPAFGRQFNTIQKAQRRRLDQKKDSNGQVDVQRASQDIILQETSAELDQLLRKQFGSSKNVSSFLDYYQQTLATAIKFINEEVLREKARQELKRLMRYR